jgi:hypothetical protein
VVVELFLGALEINIYAGRLEWTESLLTSAGGQSSGEFTGSGGLVLSSNRLDRETFSKKRTVKVPEHGSNKGREWGQGKIGGRLQTHNGSDMPYGTGLIVFQDYDETVRFLKHWAYSAPWRGQYAPLCSSNQGLESLALADRLHDQRPFII